MKHKKMLALLVFAILLFVSAHIATSTDIEPTNSYYGKHVDEDGTTTVQLRRGQSYIDGEIIPCKKTEGIEPLKEV